MPSKPIPIPRPIKLAFTFPDMEDTEINKIINEVYDKLKPLQLLYICWIRNPVDGVHLAVLMASKKQIPVDSKRHIGWKPRVEEAFHNFNVKVDLDPTNFNQAIFNAVKKDPSKVVYFKVNGYLYIN